MWGYAQPGHERNRAKIDSTIDKERRQEMERDFYASKKDTPPYLQNFQGTVGERHVENKKIVQSTSFSSASPLPFFLSARAALLNACCVAVGFEDYAKACQEDKKLTQIKHDVTKYLGTGANESERDAPLSPKL